MALDATPLLGPLTGVGTFCSSVLQEMVRHVEVEVSAFAVSWRSRGRLAGKLPHGVGWHQRAMPARPLQRAWRHMDFPSVEWFIGPVDVVHGTNFVVPPTRTAAAVVTVHDLTTLRHPDLCATPNLAFPDLVRRAARRGAWVHTPSKFVADEVVGLLGIDAGRVRAVHHGVPRVCEVPEEWAESERHNMLPEGARRYILSMGTAEPRKDLPGLVDAFDQLARDRPDVALVLVGPAGWGSAVLGARVEASHARSRIVQTGWVDDARRSAWLRGAAVLAYPSLYEGFGFPPLEAMSVGVPVVVTEAGALGEVVGDAAEMAAPADAGSLAGALARVLDDSERREALVQRGRARAAVFTWDRCARELLALYREASEARAST